MILLCVLHYCVTEPAKIHHVCSRTIFRKLYSIYTIIFTINTEYRELKVFMSIYVNS